MKQKTEIKNEKLNILETNNLTLKLVRRIHFLHFNYKQSFKKKVYLNFTLKDLLIYRENICQEVYFLNKKIEFNNHYINTCTKNLNKMYNNLLYIELLINK